MAGQLSLGNGLHLPQKSPGTTGPVTRGLRQRTIRFHAALCAIGLFPTVLRLTGVADAGPSAEVLGWSLWAPGAGYAMLGGWGIAAFIANLLLFRLAVFIWMMSGFMIVPLLVWIAPSLLAVGLADGPPDGLGQGIVVLSALGFWALQEVQRRRDVTQIALRKKERERSVPAMAQQLDAWSLQSPRPDAAHRELDPESLQAARYLFDLALQPVGSFDGFTRIDNIQGAALRYQLNWISYGLAQLQHAYTPNFHGYLNVAQRYAIESLTAPEVCSYWKWQYAASKFQWEPDPIATDNVMLTGWSLPALTVYAANTGDLRYQQDGALKFRPFANKDAVFAHDAGSFVRVINRNFDANALCLYPCEPFWTFPICNIFAMCGLMPYDRLNGTEHFESSYALFMQRLDEEFTAADWEISALTSSLTGLHRFSRTNPILQQPTRAVISYIANAFNPAVARRSYALLRDEMISLKDGRVELSTPWAKEIDLGNYRKSPAYTLAGIAQAAAEQGDEEMRVAALATADDLLEREASDDRLSYQKASNSANVKLAAARWSRRNDWRDVIANGPRPHAVTGPKLTNCSYPDVLVGKAVSDGKGLNLVLYNGAAPGPQRLTIENLVPSASYRVNDGAELHRADESGHLLLSIPLDGRTPVLISRAGG
ncbi:hypothetical protein [Sphingobium estronivorans]|uniref:linalool dehydratase/isomerase domain-containing protein n=1 Tax=Sphingobium estronivorans TaxID=1577690 RepID=UPI00123992D5|nr:hypothetical protein [Sphingobium estronivorans]